MQQTYAKTEPEEQMKKKVKFDYDMLVIGSGPAGERAALQAAKLNHSVAIIERHEVIGGVMIHTGTLPSKTLRETLNETRGVKHAALEDNRLSLSLEPDASLNDILTMLTRQYRIESLHTESSTLHDVYLEVVAASEDGEVREESKAREESEDGR